jgi:phospholipid transport system transporter-binding protein
MLLLPNIITAGEAPQALRVLSEGLKASAAHQVVISASQLTRFDSAALAVLLACQRAAFALGKSFELQHAPPKLMALARLYGVHDLLGCSAVVDL